MLEVLEELEFREDEEEATVGLRWVKRELSRVCSDRYGAGTRHRTRNQGSVICTQHMSLVHAFSVHAKHVT